MSYEEMAKSIHDKADQLFEDGYALGQKHARQEALWLSGICLFVVAVIWWPL